MSDDPRFIEAAVARLPKDVSDRKSGVLVARSMGYLAVRVLFHGAPVVGISVSFCRIADATDNQPEQMEPALSTDGRGLALFPRLVTAGIYRCEIERQAPTNVPTVARLQDPYPVALPIGRPLVDVGDVDEFAHGSGEA